MRTLTENYVFEALSPQIADGAAVGTPWTLMDAVDPVLFYVIVGATDTTVDVKVEQATASDGTAAKDLTGSDITQLSAAAGDNKQVAIEVEPARMDIKNGFVYARVLVTAGDGTEGAYVAGVSVKRSRHNPPTQPTAFTQRVRVAVEENTS